MTVYFYQAQSPVGEIKIGYTASLDTRPRMKSIATSTPYPLRELAKIPYATIQDERALHHLHRRDRIHPGGEWFYPTPAVMASVAKAQAGKRYGHPPRSRTSSGLSSEMKLTLVIMSILVLLIIVGAAS